MLRTIQIDLSSTHISGIGSILDSFGDIEEYFSNNDNSLCKIITRDFIKGHDYIIKFIGTRTRGLTIESYKKSDKHIINTLSQDFIKDEYGECTIEITHLDNMTDESEEAATTFSPITGPVDKSIFGGDWDTDEDRDESGLNALLLKTPVNSANVISVVNAFVNGGLVTTLNEGIISPHLLANKIMNDIDDASFNSVKIKITSMDDEEKCEATDWLDSDDVGSIISFIVSVINDEFDLENIRVIARGKNL